MLLPLVRLARCASAALHPPLEVPEATGGGGAGAIAATAGTPLVAAAAMRGVAAAAAAAPALATLLWVRPFAEGVLGLNADARGALQAAALVACGKLAPRCHCSRPASCCASSRCTCATSIPVRANCGMC
jgi:hypothetical protein